MYNLYVLCINMYTYISIYTLNVYYIYIYIYMYTKTILYTYIVSICLVSIYHIYTVCVYIYMIIYAPKHEFLEVFLPRQMAPQARWVAVATRLIGWFNMTSPTRLQYHPSNITSSGKRMQIDKWGRCVLPLSFDSNPSECIACIPTQDSAVKLCQFTLSSLALCTWNFIPVRN